MKRMTIALITAVGLLVGCSKSEPEKVETTSQTKSRKPGGETTTTTTESTQVGSTLQSKTEVKADTPQGKVTTTAETFIGTVTQFTPGGKIEVMTGEKKTHAVDLSKKDVVAIIDPGITVGSKVRLTEEKDSQSKIVTLTVKREG